MIYDAALGFKDGLAPVRLDGAWGYIVVANAKKGEREWKKQHLKLPRWTVLRKKT